ncbi:DUF6286 domain-containing Asp23/Gls24 family envelope stress response protein [Streptomyces sp. NPDC059398]|uniref:DUF6286 domain-containing Asp23/Gls24 family envelope stress response protein n=1 Tax=Streptomyces sp. NPDC059398 TaxID=3346820 RepID=UPI0036765CB0
MTAPAERGTLTVADRAVRRIAERAAGEALPPGDARVTRGSVTVQGRRAQVAVDVALPYPAPLDDAGSRIQRRVTDRTAALTGLAVPDARIHIRALPARTTVTSEPGDAAGHQPHLPNRPHHSHRPHRPWAERRIPAALLGLTAAAGCGLLLYDVVQVHAAHRAPARWRTGLLDQLAGHGPGDTVVTAVGAVAAVAGLWLLLLALTPGARRVLPMTPLSPELHAVLERRAVAVLVRDAVAAVPGITRVRTRVGRRRVTVRARLGFGDRATARREVTEAVTGTLTRCGLARPLRPHTRVTPAPHWQDTPPPQGPAPQPRPGKPPAAPAPDAHTPTPAAPDTLPLKEAASDEPTP